MNPSLITHPELRMSSFSLVPLDTPSHHASLCFYNYSDFRKNHYFLENSTTLNKTESLHSSALLAFRFPVELKGRNCFVGNLGGGITLLNARLSVTGELLLLSNVAMFGGGIAMDDSCLVSIL